jgi:hypothetical protein
MNESVHKSYSGYPGGLKEMPLKYVVEKKGYAELITHAVNGMLPKNQTSGYPYQESHYQGLTNKIYYMSVETKNRYIEAVGRRKTAIARVRITPGTKLHF